MFDSGASAGVPLCLTVFPATHRNVRHICGVALECGGPALVDQNAAADRHPRPACAALLLVWPSTRTGDARPSWMNSYDRI